MNNIYLLYGLCFFVGIESRYTKLEASLVFTVNDDPKTQLTKDQVRSCAHQTELSMEELMKFDADYFHNVSETTQCFTQCLYEQIGWIKDGVFVDQDFLSYLSDQPWQGCQTSHSANKCEKAFMIHQCMVQLKNGEPQTTLEETTTEFDATNP